MYFIMHVLCKRLIIQIYEYYFQDCFEADTGFIADAACSFCVWMIRWYLNLAQNLKMFQNCLTMPHTTVPTIITFLSVIFSTFCTTVFS